MFIKPFIISLMVLQSLNGNIQQNDTNTPNFLDSSIIAVYDNHNSGLSYPSVKTIIEDQNGLYWIGTGKGIFLFDKILNKWKSLSKENGDLYDDEIEQIIQGTDNRIWIIPESRTFSSLGINCFNYNQWEKISASNSTLGISDKSLEIYPVYTSFHDQEGGMWFVIQDKLVFFNGKVWEKPIQLSNKIGESGPVLINTGIQDRNGIIWLGRKSNGIIRYDPKQYKWESFNPGKNNVNIVGDGLDNFRTIKSTNISSIYEDREGKLWFAAGDGTVYVYEENKNTWASYDLLDKAHLAPCNTNSLTCLTVNALHQDRTGRMLFATNMGLITFLEGQNTWALYTSSNSKLPSNYITTFMQDRNSNLWIGTTKGILVLSL